MKRVDEHCGSCGTTEKNLGIICTCPCHEWEDRICSCGGIRKLLEYRIGIKVKLDGSSKPHLKVYRAECQKCGNIWKRRESWR